MSTETKLSDKIIRLLCAERGETPSPVSDDEKFRYFRALVNVRPPVPASAELLSLQDEYLRVLSARRGVTCPDELAPAVDGIYLWKGDITTLACDGIVNAANSQMLGCFCPNHGCIDNAIHTFAGIQLRLECAEKVRARGGRLETGRAEITRAYNLPCKYVLHTVGPIVYGALTERHESELADCYRSCLSVADANGLKSLAFCCISTGEFRFPNARAAEIAVRTVREYREKTQTKIDVIFNVFKDTDHALYANILGIER